MTDNKLAMEEILDMNGIGSGHYQYRNETLKAMSEYAQQEAVAFAKFLDNLKINADKYFNVPISATTEQLYNIYKNKHNENRNNIPMGEGE